MEGTEIDLLLSVLENPIRRKILAKLARETHYPLQLSKELGVSQQAIMKHIKVLEENGFVESCEEPSDAGGPPRKCYVPTQRFSIRIDIGPNTFESDVYPFDEEKDWKTLEDDEEDIMEHLFELGLAKSTPDPSNRLAKLSEFIQGLNQEIDALEVKRRDLIKVREEALEDAHNLIGGLSQDYKARRLLYFALTNDLDSILDVAESLDLGQREVRELLQDLIDSNILAARAGKGGFIMTGRGSKQRSLIVREDAYVTSIKILKDGKKRKVKVSSNKRK